QRAGVSRVPDVAVPVLDQTVGPGVRRLQRIFPEAAVFGSSRPRTLFIWPVYQSDPSAAASGSWGRDPGVGTGHSLIETLAGPGITTPAGFAFSGKFLVKYSVIVATWSAGTVTP